MRTLARPIGLGLAARGDIEDVVGWSRRARDAGLDSVWVHDSYFERDAVSFTSAIASAIGGDGDKSLVEGEAGFRVALGAVNPFTRHPGGPGDDRLGARRDAARPDRHGPRDRPAAAPEADGHPVRPGLGRRGRVEGDGPDPGALGGRAPAVRDARPAADPADVPADPPDPARHRRVPQGVRGAGRPEGGRLPRPSGRIDPEPDRDPGTPGRGRRGGGPRPGLDRDRRLPALARRRDPARGAQPGQARAVRDLHDVGAVRRLPRPGGLRGRPARPDRRPPGEPRTTRPPATSSRTSSSTRSCCAGRARTSRPRRWRTTRRPAWACRSSSRSSRTTTRSTN